MLEPRAVSWVGLHCTRHIYRICHDIMLELRWLAGDGTLSENQKVADPPLWLLHSGWTPVERGPSLEEGAYKTRGLGIYAGTDAMTSWRPRLGNAAGEWGTANGCQFCGRAGSGGHGCGWRALKLSYGLVGMSPQREGCKFPPPLPLPPSTGWAFNGLGMRDPETPLSITTGCDGDEEPCSPY